MAGTLQVLEAMLAHIAQAHATGQVMFYKVACCLGKEYVSSTRRAHNACRVMHIDAHVAFGDQRWFTGMQSHTYTHYRALGPGMIRQSALTSYSRRNSIRGTSEGDEEGISLRVNFIAIPLLERSA